MSLPAEIEELIASKNHTIAVKDRVIAEREQRIAELEREVGSVRRQVGLNSSNRSKPSSSDGLKKKQAAARRLRGCSGKTSGGQKSHRGNTLR